jgi:hypothetical protein
MRFIENLNVGWNAFEYLKSSKNHNRFIVIQRSNLVENKWNNLRLNTDLGCRVHSLVRYTKSAGPERENLGPGHWVEELTV